MTGAQDPDTAAVVHPDVWADALRRAGGDPGRIEVVSATSVVIHNRADWRAGRPRRESDRSAADEPSDAVEQDAAGPTEPNGTAVPAERSAAPVIPAAHFVAPRLDERA